MNKRGISLILNPIQTGGSQRGATRWKLGETKMEDIKIIQGDCLEKMKEIEDKSVDMILCDLPYGTTACKWDIVIP